MQASYPIGWLFFLVNIYAHTPFVEDVLLIGGGEGGEVRGRQGEGEVRGKAGRGGGEGEGRERGR